MKIIARYGTDHQGMVVVSYPPQKRSVPFTTVIRYLSFPALLFKIVYFRSGNSYFATQFCVGAAETSNPTNETIIYGPVLPNTRLGDLNVCLGATVMADTVEALVNKCIARFWSSRFTVAEWHGVKHPGVTEWSILTRKDPSWVPPLTWFANNRAYKDWLLLGTFYGRMS